MRWSYLIPRAVIVGVVWLFFAFAFDPMLRFAVVASGQSATGARVDVDTVQTRFFPPVVSVQGVQVAKPSDPWKNAVEFEKLHVRFEGKPLLRKSFIIEEASIAGVRWNTPRQTSGALTDTELSVSNKYAKFVGDKAKAIGADWYDDFVQRMKMQVDPNQFASVRLANNLQTEWTTRFDNYEKRIKDLEKKFKQIEQTAKNAKGNTLRKIEAYRKAAEDAQKLALEAQRLHRELEQLPKTVNADFRRVEVAREQDKQLLKKKLTAFQLDAATLSKTLLGPTLQAKIDDAIAWADWIKKGVDKVTYRGPQPDRYRGVNVPFAVEKQLPKFLVRKLHISGEADWRNEKMPFKGLITGITSHPQVHGKPIVVKLHGEATSELNLIGTADYTGDKPVHTVRMSLEMPALQQIQLGDSKKLGLAVEAKRSLWTANVTLKDNRLGGTVTLAQDLKHTRTAPAANAHAVRQASFETIDFDAARMLQTALGNVKQFKASVILSGTYKEPKWTLQSNLGTQIADGVNRMIASELALKRQQLTKSLDETVNKKTGALAKKLNDKYGALLSQLKLHENGTQQFLRRIAGGAFPADALPGGVDFNKLPIRLPRSGDRKRQPLGNLPKNLDINRLFRR